MLQRFQRVGVPRDLQDYVETAERRSYEAFVACRYWSVGRRGSRSVRLAGRSGGIGGGFVGEFIKSIADAA